MQLLEEHPKQVGYLLKERIFDVVILIDALQRLADGETIIDPTIVSRLLVTPRRPSQGPDRARARSARARRRGTLKQNKRGVRSLITERTVEAHVKQIFLKLGLQADADSHRRMLAHVRDATQPLKSTAKPPWPVDAPAGLAPRAEPRTQANGAPSRSGAANEPDQASRTRKTSRPSRRFAACRSVGDAITGASGHRPAVTGAFQQRGPDTPGRSEQRPGLTSDAGLGALVFVEPVARVVLAVSRMAAR
jgi:hypothetical protein